MKPDCLILRNTVTFYTELKKIINVLLYISYSSILSKRLCVVRRIAWGAKSMLFHIYINSSPFNDLVAAGLV